MPVPEKLAVAVDRTGEFALALVRHWKAFVSSSVFLGVALSTWERVSGTNIQFRYYAMLLAIGLFCACFTAWLEEYGKRTSLQAQLAGQRPRLVLGHDYDYPAGYIPGGFEFRDWSPFYIRNDGGETAHNVRLTILDERFARLLISPLGNYPPDGERKRMKIWLDREEVSFGFLGALLKLAGWEQRVGGTEIVVPVSVSYANDRGEAFNGRFDLMYRFTDTGAATQVSELGIDLR